MNKIIQWLHQRPWLNALLIGVYFVAVVMPHKRFGTFLNTKVFVGITRDEYNAVVLFGGLLLLSVFTIIFLKNSSALHYKKRLWTYMAINIACAAIALNILFVINIEVIHFPQYAFFAILCFPLLMNYQQTLIWTTIAGALDEAYQYFYLSPMDTGYYDFNDVVTNLIGAVFGLLFLRSFGVNEQHRPPFLRSSAFAGLLIVASVVIITCLTGYLSIYPSETTTYQLVREWPPGFWSVVHPNVSYHVMLPIEGLVVTSLLTMLYYRLGSD